MWQNDRPGQFLIVNCFLGFIMDDTWTEDSPIRPTNWRWLRANYYIENDQTTIPRSPDNDKYVVAAALFKRYLDTARPEVLRHTQKIKYQAWKINTDAAYNRSRWELEARLIAGQTNEDIGIRISVYPESVAYYEKWFYNVRDRLNNVGYIFNNLIAPLMPNNPKETDYEMLWKFYGLRADGNVLDSLIYGFCNKAYTTDAQSVQGFWIEDYQENLSRKGALAAKLVKVDFNSYVKILDQRIKLLEVNKDTGAGTTVQDSVLYNIQVALEQTPWLEEKTRQNKAQIQGATLRAGELLELENNAPSAEFVKVLESASYPVDE